MVPVEGLHRPRAVGPGISRSGVAWRWRATGQASPVRPAPWRCGGLGELRALERRRELRDRAAGQRLAEQRRRAAARLDRYLAIAAGDAMQGAGPEKSRLDSESKGDSVADTEIDMGSGSGRGGGLVAEQENMEVDDGEEGVVVPEVADEEGREPLRLLRRYCDLGTVCDRTQTARAALSEGQGGRGALPRMKDMLPRMEDMLP